MKRFLIIGAVGVTLIAMLVVGLALVVAVTPVRAQIGQAIGQVLQGQPILSAVQAQSFPNVQLKAEKGILVGGVFVDSPADKAGIVRGDIILKVDGQDVNTNLDLNGIIANHKVGDALSLLIQHGDQQKTVTATLAQPLAATASPQTTPQAAPQTTPQAGANNGQQPKRLLRQTGPFLGIIPIGTNQGRGGKVGNGQPGAVIEQVATGSPAEKAGLKAGETITAVDGTALGPQNSLSTVIASHKVGDSVKLDLTASDGTKSTVTVTLGDNPQKQGTAYLGVSVREVGSEFRGLIPGFPGNPNNGGANNNGPQNGMPFRRGVVPGLLGYQGALVGQVTTGSPAEKAGLKAGQLIEAVDGKKLDSQTALSDALSTHKPGDKVTLSVFDPTTSKSTDVQVTLGDNPQKAGTAWLGISYGYIHPQPLKNGAGTQL